MYENENYSDGYQTIKPQKEKKPGKIGGYFKKVLVCATLGIFFGLCAGLGFIAVEQTMGGSLITREQTVIPSTSGVSTKDTTTEVTPVSSTKNDGEIDQTKSVTAVTTDVSTMVKEVMPAMVSISNSYTESINFFGQDMQQQGESVGSGIIVGQNDTELLVVTNYHVIEGADSLAVTFVDDAQIPAQVKGTDANMDLAVLAVSLDDLTEETKNQIAVAVLGDSDSLTLGEPAIAIGNALGYGQSVTTGVVSALNREIALESGITGTFIQTNAAINPGNSGGALLNLNGEVIGINSNKIGGTTIEGMGYAIPISAAKPIISELMLKTTKTKIEDSSQMGYLGIQLATVTPEVAKMYAMPQGIYVTTVIEGEPAEAAGVLQGDIITKFDDMTITSYDDLQEALQYYPAGTTVEITVSRAGTNGYEEHVLSLTLGNRPDENQ